MRPAKALCILITEDHPDSLHAMARLLRHNGHTVYGARTAAEARDLAAAHPCDVFIGDIGLQDASGIALMRELRALHRLKGIAVSGHTEARDVAASLDAGYDKHLPQPVLYSDLLAAIDEVAG